MSLELPRTPLELRRTPRTPPRTPVPRTPGLQPVCSIARPDPICALFVFTLLFLFVFMPRAWAGGEEFLEERQGKRVDKAIIPSNYENKMSDPLDAKDTDMRDWVVDIDMVYKHETEEGVCQEVSHRLVSSNLIPYQVGPGQEYIGDLLHKQQVLNDFEKSPYDRNGVEDVGFIDIDNDGTKENILRRSWSFRGVMSEKLYLLDSNLSVNDKNIVTITKKILIEREIKNVFPYWEAEVDSSAPEHYSRSVMFGQLDLYHISVVEYKNINYLVLVNFTRGRAQLNSTPLWVLVTKLTDFSSAPKLLCYMDMRYTTKDNK